MGIHLLTQRSEAEHCTAQSQPRGVAQEYLSPLLLGGYKWDFRLYVLASDFKVGEFWIHDEGFARFCGVKYSTATEGLGNYSAHLTNTSVSDGHGTSGGDASVITTAVLWERLAAAGHPIQQMKTKVKTLLEEVFTGVAPFVMKASVAKESKYGQESDGGFSLLGVDVMFDADGRPWLLEINYDPSMTCHAQFQKEVKARVITDVRSIIYGDMVDETTNVDALSWEVVKRVPGEMPALKGGFTPLECCAFSPKVEAQELDSDL